MSNLNLVYIFLELILIFEAGTSYGFTNPVDVAAINSLYIAVGSPILPRWTSVGGDPCGDAWQGVECDGSNISSIKYNVANMNGDLGDNLGSFASIKIIDLSNNQIGGTIPTNLPVSLQQLYLADNKFTGSIPDSLSSMNQLSAMSLNGNQLTGDIPDSFQGLTVLVNLDLSSNKLTGQLPPSLEGLSSLTTFRLQNNQLSGTLDVLQDLPLRDLNVENNSFSGPIPEKLLSIAIFKSDGNPFNTSVAPSAPPTSPTGSPTLPTARPPAPPFFRVPASGQTPEKAPGNETPSRPADGPSATTDANSKKTNQSSNTKKIVWISIGSVFSVVILLLLLVLLIPRCCKERGDRVPRRYEIAPYIGNRENLREYGSLEQPFHQTEKGPKVDLVKPQDNYLKGPIVSSLAPMPREELNVDKMSAVPKVEDHEIDMTRFDFDSMLPPPPPPPPPPSPPPQLAPPAPPPMPLKSVTVNPILPAQTIPVNSSSGPLPPTTVRSYSIASLQQYTNSFSQENLIGGGMLGNVYTAQLPNGKLVAVKKLDRRVSSQLKDDKFLDLVNSIDKIRHANVVEILGYCAEHGQRLLVYEYCSNGTLQDALLADDESKPSWNLRIRMALGAARALQYLHEFCEPPVVHRNFKSSNVLLDDELTVHVSDCGLAPLISSGSVSQLSGNLLSTYGYGAPEFESGIYTSMSDVYSFGVVMLELLTGRKSHDSTRSRTEQFLARWAIPQLHDIDALSRMVDPSLQGKYPVKSLSRFADIIFRCVQPEPEFRPLMSEVVQDLLQLIRRDFD
ncbi:hypothetical protein DCAR_0310992 [Daucus carota subsp. sativus]|uniref:Protein kinase domain-containing protein n=2 Tax=Daucus carota subsp. sativus TaxID=79200 RepID=A0AAF1ASV9_DAUCS|nr:hypothetical protein DCAR_0310992 [Daucus carota subsp. sativus]